MSQLDDLKKRMAERMIVHKQRLADQEKRLGKYTPPVIKHEPSKPQHHQSHGMFPETDKEKKEYQNKHHRAWNE